MGWFWSLACLGAFLVNCVYANEDWAGMGQREIDFDELMLEMSQPEPLQKEVAIHEFFEQRPMDPRDIIKAIMKNENSREAFEPKGQPIVGQLGPHSRSFLDFVLFPPGQPTHANLEAICLHGRHRPRYPLHSLPQTGFSWLMMEGNAINHVETWYDMCCQEHWTQGQEVTLCCVKQAWESSLNAFCREQFSVKMSHHSCCKKRGEARMRCFQSKAPNPTYEPKEETPVPLSSLLPGFTFNPITCQSPQLIPRSSRGGQRKPLISPRNVSISFPPGRPTAMNIQLICRFSKFRPRYLPKCLLGTGYSWLARQSKTVNRVEKGFKTCCKGQDDTLTCADEKWRKEMDKFCREEKGGKSRFPCCVTEEGDERYNCFSSHAPHPGYHRVSTSAATPLDSNLGQICETDMVIEKQSPVAFLKSVVNPCCPLSDEFRTSCVLDKLVHRLEFECSQMKPSSIIFECCTTTSQDTPKCLSDLLTPEIARITKLPRQRKKICPLL